MNKCSHATVEYTGQRFFEGAEFVRCQSCGENMVVDLCDYRGIGHGLYNRSWIIQYGHRHNTEQTKKYKE